MTVAELKDQKQNVPENPDGGNPLHIVNVDFGKGYGIPYGENEVKVKFVPSRGAEEAVSILSSFREGPDALPVLLPIKDMSAVEELISAAEEGDPKKILARELGIENDTIRFASLHQAAPILPIYMRHEIGYSLLFYATKQSNAHLLSIPLAEAIWNTGHMFLLSAGVKWHLSGDAMADARRLYKKQFKEILGAIPRKSLSEAKTSDELSTSLAATDIYLQQLNMPKDMEAYITEGWDDIEDLGIGFPYMLQQMAKQSAGARVNLITGPYRPEYYDNQHPIGVSSITIYSNSPDRISS